MLHAIPIVSNVWSSCLNTPTETRHHLPEAFARPLGELLGENFITVRDECWTYGYDNSRQHALPEVVLRPDSHEQIVRILQLCKEFSIPLTARGYGTNTTGAAIPLQGGAVLSLERMNRILQVDPANRLMVVEPGVTNQAVQEEAAKHGFFWPPDPTSAAVCSVGGNLACNAAGPRAVKYGSTRDNVLGLRAIAGTGDELRTGTRTTKGVVGYDLTRLLIGSEGTLGIITEATLKLSPLPEATRTLQASYQDVQSAAHAISAIMAQPMVPCALEFLDGQAIAIIRGYAGDDVLPEAAESLLMIEIDGPRACLDEATRAVVHAAKNSGCIGIIEAVDAAEVASLWKTRKALSPALRKLAPKKINEDVVVPVSHIPALIQGLQQLAEAHRITIVNFGHAGNGNLHVNLLVNPDVPSEMERASRCLHEVFALVLRLEGTLSGEHGIGLVKRDFVNAEITPPTLAVMQAIKQVFDPQGLLNPGKKLPGI